MQNGIQTIFDGSNAELVERVISLCFPGSPSILDVTYGNGCFWNGSIRPVVRCDRDPIRAKDACCDFTKLPFADGSFDVVVYDPPFQPQTNVIKKNITDIRFTRICGGTPGVRKVVDAGLREAWRVSKLGVLYKCQDYINARKPVWMSLWAYDLLGAPYEIIHRRHPSKLISSKWVTQQSARRNHTTFMVWTRKNERIYKRQSNG